MAKALTGTRIPADQRKRGGIGEALAYAVGHRIRIDALAILAEGVHSPSEIASILHANVSTVARNVRELYESGCIEYVTAKPGRSSPEHFYRAVEIPEISQKEYEALSHEARSEIITLIVQAIIAEVMASLLAGKLEGAEEIGLVWDCVPVDDQGKREIEAERTESYQRIKSIKGRNINRLAKAKSEGTMMIVVGMGFERSRPGRPDGGYVPPDLLPG